MRQASKRENIIMVYTKDMSVSYSDIALLTDSNVNYVNQCYT